MLLAKTGLDEKQREIVSLQLNNAPERMAHGAFLPFPFPLLSTKITRSLRVRRPAGGPVDDQCAPHSPPEK